MSKSALSLLVLTAIASLSLTAPAPAGERELDVVDGWRVILNRNADNSFNRCIAESTQKGKMLRVASTGQSMDFSLSVPASGHKKGEDGTIGFNGNQPEFFRFDADKSRAWTVLNWDMEQFMETARTVEVGVGNVQMQWKLAGFQNAIVAMTDCVNQYAG
jgi:hypothetical protein